MVTGEKNVLFMLMQICPNTFVFLKMRVLHIKRVVPPKSLILMQIALKLKVKSLFHAHYS